MKVFAGGKTVNIPDDFITKNMNSLGITKEEAVNLFLSDEGIAVDEAVIELTAKAKAAGPINHDARAKKERKAPERKPDMLKRELIAMLFQVLDEEKCGTDIVNVSVTNIERMIIFEVNGEKFELTLTKKRKAKE